MKNTWMPKISRIGCAALLAVLCASAQEHKWAGRTLDDFEWTIHEKLRVLPSYGVFDTVRFEVEGHSVILSGQVMKDAVKQNAGRLVGHLDGVTNVVNNIEVLPPSRRDDALRANLYRVIYEKEPLEKYGDRSAPPIHIIVKNGWASLEGVVDSEADRSMIRLRALRATDHLSDNLRVAAGEL